MTVPAPRCWKPLRRRDDTAVPGEAFVCGRPAGHNGPCRSRGAVTRYYQTDTRRRSERYAALRDAGIGYWEARAAAASGAKCAALLEGAAA